MSSNLYWRPFGYGEKALPDELKFVLRKSSYYNSSNLDMTLTYDDIAYFKGLQDADVKGADKVVEAIEKYDEIELKEVF